tara:strand:- start:3751 stop:4974 length:1224 start_codon:yes stop_codon:yes gene_type:complete
MFYIGGALKGFGDAAFDTVKLGRAEKHDKEMLNTRETLRKKALLEARDYSRQQQMLKDRKARKLRGQALKELGLNDNTVAVLSQNEFSTENAMSLGKLIEERAIQSGDTLNINDFYETKYTGDPMKQKKEGEIFSLGKFYESDLEAQLPYSVKRMNMHLLREKPSLDEQEAELANNHETLMIKAEGEQDAGKREELNKQAELAFSKLESFKIGRKKSSVRQATLQEAPRATLEVLDGQIKNMNTEIKSEFQILNKEAENNPQLAILMERLGYTPTGGIQGGTQAEREIVYNLIRTRVVDRNLGKLKDKDTGEYLKEYQDLGVRLEDYFSEFLDIGRTNVFQGRVYEEGQANNQVPTFAFLNYMRDKPDQEIIIPSRDNFKIDKFTQQDIENYIRNYTQYHQAMPRGI